MSRDDLYSIVRGSPTPRNHDLARFVSEHAHEIAEALPDHLSAGLIQVSSDSGRMALLRNYLRMSALAMPMMPARVLEPSDGLLIRRLPHPIHEPDDSDLPPHIELAPEWASSLMMVACGGNWTVQRDSISHDPSESNALIFLGDRISFANDDTFVSASAPPVLRGLFPAGPDEPEEVFGHGAPPEPLPDTGAHEPVARPNDRLLSPAQFAAQHEPMSPQTARNHILARRIIGWRHGPKRWVIPEDQLGVEGYFECMPDLLSHFPSSAIAWHWLNRPNRNTGGETPLARLREGAEAEVLVAARMYEAGDFT